MICGAQRGAFCELPALARHSWAADCLSVAAIPKRPLEERASSQVFPSAFALESGVGESAALAGAQRLGGRARSLADR